MPVLNPNSTTVRSPGTHDYKRRYPITHSVRGRCTLESDIDLKYLDYTAGVFIGLPPTGVEERGARSLHDLPLLFSTTAKAAHRVFCHILCDRLHSAHAI